MSKQEVPDAPIVEDSERAAAVAKVLRDRYGIFAKVSEFKNSVWALWWVSIGEHEPKIHYPIHLPNEDSDRGSQVLTDARRWERMGPRAIAKEIRRKETIRARKWAVLT